MPGVSTGNQEGLEYSGPSTVGLLEGESMSEETNIPKRKRCSICKVMKDLESFSPCSTGKYGRYAYCRDCRNSRLFESNPNREEIDEKRALRIGLRANGLKRCTSCKEIKPLEDFYGDPRRTDGKQSRCKECFLQKGNHSYLKKEYGITPEQFGLLMDSQDGRCWICNRVPKKNKFNIDHDHDTHFIRGLVCVNCNTNLLPYIEKFPELVKRAFVYLENPPAFAVIGKISVPESNQARRRKKVKI